MTTPDPHAHGAHAVQAGWYDDPQMPGQQRWFDGTQWTDHTQTAPSAGPPHLSATPAVPANLPVSGKATGSLISGIIGLLLIPFLASLLGLVLGILAKRDIKRSQGTLGGNQRATVGIVLSALGLGTGFFMLAILMAVAIPVFLGQQTKASATQAKVTVSNLSDAMQSCSAGSLDGTFSECGADEISSDEPALALRLDIGCNKPGGACVESVSSDSYTVRATTDPVGGSFATYSIEYSNGQSSRTCEPRTSAARRACPTGTW